MVTPARNGPGHARGVSMSISFKLRGVPEFSVHIEPEKVYLEEGKVDNADVIIEGNLPLSFLIFEGGISLGNVVKSWLTGKIKIRKGYLRIFKLRKAFKVFQEAFSHVS